MDLRLLQPLRHRDYRLLTVGSLVSLLGDGMFVAAIALQVYALSDLPTALSVVTFIVIGSQLLVLLVGGWAADRYDRRRILLTADLVRGATIGALGVLSLAGALQLWHIWLLVALQGLANGFAKPTAAAFVPDLVPEEDLPAANALLAAANPVAATLAGPAIGGLLVALAGPGGAFVLDAGTFAFSAAMLALMRTGGVAEAGPSRPGLAAQVVEGLRFVRAHPWCWAWIAGESLGMVGYTGPFQILVPFLYRFDPVLGLTQDQAGVAFGLTLSAGGLGAIAVSLAVGQFRLPRRLTTAMFLAEGAGVGLLAVFGVMTAVWQAVLAVLFAQGLYAFTEIGQATLFQRGVPARLLGRVSSVSWLAAMAAALVSVTLAGPLAQVVGARQVLIGGAVVGTAGVLSMLLVPGAGTVPEPARGADTTAAV